MRAFLLLLFIISQISFTQNVKLTDSISLKADTFIGADDFENYYYTIGNTLYKKEKKKTYSYTNTQLGNITSVDITNPLKILVFYEAFNSIILLDNRLNEFTNTINFTTENFAKNIAFAGIASNDNIWLFSKDDNTLSLWNYKTKATIFESQPMSFYNKNFEVITMKSNYKTCRIFSKNKYLTFNEYGSFINDGVLQSNIGVFYANGSLYVKDNKLYYYHKDSIKEIEGFSSSHASKNIKINNNKLYFFKSNHLYSYEVIKN